MRLEHFLPYDVRGQNSKNDNETNDDNPQGPNKIQ